MAGRRSRSGTGGYDLWGNMSALSYPTLDDLAECVLPPVIELAWDAVALVGIDDAEVIESASDGRAGVRESTYE